MDEEIERLPGFLSVDHVAVSVMAGQLEAHVEVYRSLGFSEVHREEVLGGDQVREVLLQIGDGSNRIQLLEPLTPESPVARAMERNGGRAGLTHVAFRVRDIHKAFAWMKRRGFNVIDPQPRRGSQGTMIFFVHPKTTEAASFGYLLEVVQRSNVG